MITYYVLVPSARLALPSSLNKWSCNFITTVSVTGTLGFVFAYLPCPCCSGGGDSGNGLPMRLGWSCRHDWRQKPKPGSFWMLVCGTWVRVSCQWDTIGASDWSDSAMLVCMWLQWHSWQDELLQCGDQAVPSVGLPPVQFCSPMYRAPSEEESRDACLVEGS